MLHYRLGDKVRIEKLRRSSIWDGMTGIIAHISLPDRYGFSMYGINLDEADANGKTKVVMITSDPRKPHRRLTKLDVSNLHPKFLNYKFKFSK